MYWEVLLSYFIKERRSVFQQKIFYYRSTNRAVFCPLQWMSFNPPSLIGISSNREIPILLNVPLCSIFSLNFSNFLWSNSIIDHLAVKALLKLSMISMLTKILPYPTKQMCILVPAPFWHPIWTIFLQWCRLCTLHARNLHFKGIKK